MGCRSQRDTDKVYEKRRVSEEKRLLKRRALELEVKCSGGRKQQKQIIHRHLRRVRSAAWFWEAESLGKGLKHAISQVLGPDE